jgi:hypothetical protein
MPLIFQPVRTRDSAVVTPLARWEQQDRPLSFQVAQRVGLFRSGARRRPLESGKVFNVADDS